MTAENDTIEKTAEDYALERELRDSKSQQRVRDAIKVLFDELNSMGNEKLISEAANQEIANTHRTLQQNLFRDFIVPVIRGYAQRHKDGWFDLRNEASCKAAVELAAVLEDKGFPFV